MRANLKKLNKEICRGVSANLKTLNKSLLANIYKGVSACANQNKCKA